MELLPHTNAGSTVANLVLEAGLRAEFAKAYNAVIAGDERADLPLYLKLVMEVPSTKLSEKYGWLGSLAHVREWVGDRQITGLRDFLFEIENKKYELTVGLNRDIIDDDQTSSIMPRVRQLPGRYFDLIVEKILALILAGETTLCYDGQYFFDDTHPKYDKDGNVLGTYQDNLLAKGTYNITGSDMSVVALALMNACAVMADMENDRGDKLKLKPDMIVMHGKYSANILRVITATTWPGTVKDPNVLTAQYQLTPLFDNDLEDDGTFYLYCTKLPPIIQQNRRPLETVFIDPSAAKDPMAIMREEGLFGLSFRKGWGPGFWQGALKIT